MIQIDMASHKRTLEKLQNLETTMENEKNNQLLTADNMLLGWKGFSAMTFQAMQTNMLQNGLYQKTLSQVTNMRKIMEDALPIIRSLKCMSDTFYYCLEGKEPDTSMDTQGRLLLDEVKVESIDECCSSILSYNETIYTQLTQIMSACSGLVSFGDCASRLNQAYEKVARIGALKTAIDTYARKVIDLDAGLALEYKATYGVYADSNPFMKQGSQTDLLGEGMRQKVKSLLEKSASEWSEDELSYLARTVDEAFKTQNTEIIDAYLDYLLCECYFGSEEKGSISSHSMTNYMVTVDETKVTCLLEEMEKEGLTGEAYYSIQRLANYCYTDKKKGYYDAQTSEKDWRFSHTVSVVDGEVCIELNVKDADSQKSKDTISFTCVNMQNEIRMTEELEALGFTEKELETFRTSVYTDGDIDFLKLLSMQDYTNAFEYGLSKCSSFTGENIVDYIMKLEQTNNCAEQEKIINTLLYNTEINNMTHKGYLYDKSTHGEYIDLILATLSQDMEISKETALLQYTKNGSQTSLTKAYEYENRLFRQNALWNAINKIYTCDFREYDDATGAGLELMSHSIASGYSYAKIDGLSSDGNDESTYQFNFTFMGSEQDYDGNTTLVDRLDGDHLICQVVIEEGIDCTLSEKTRANRDLNTQIKKLPAKTIVQCVFIPIDSTIPGASTIVNLANAAMTYDGKEFTSNVLQLPYSDYHEKLGGVELGASEADAVISAIFEYQKLTADIEANEKSMQEVTTGKTASLSMMYYDGVTGSVEQYVPGIALCGETMTAVSTVRSHIIVQEDGIEKYLNDVCDGNVDSEVLQHIKTVTVNVALEKYNKEPTIQNYVNYIKEVNTVVESVDLGNNTDLYKWLQGE